ncbi:unnamed protein product [Albugo candida]|uniref:Chloride conductance regulatory protein ICln n=1 Tax=Albugo candida TaxID=65357 RepID=A0A024GHY1_9STRA|nr:unnamed protein product [Albugo candida]|eukprot:CCI46131.1 unnamed protein product [Albugo candida]
MKTLRHEDVDDNGKPILDTGSLQEGNVEPEIVLDTFDDVKLAICTNSCKPVEGSELSEGKVYVTSRRAVWIANTSTDAFRGYSWDIKCITLHAISRDPTAFPVPCLYCQIEAENATEMRFVPSQSEDLTRLYLAFSKSAEMNPDEEDVPEGAGEEGDWIYDEDEILQDAQAAEMAAHYDSILEVSSEMEQMQFVTGQFDDAEEDDPAAEDHLL